MTFGSLFSGIGGMDYGLERAGWTVRFQVEIDAYCRRVLAKHWPEVERHGDIRDVDGTCLPRVDLLAGGFPCQPFSVAGRRAGTADERWFWPEFARLIRDLRPHYVLVENPAGLLTTDGGRGVAGVLGGLAALGYDAEWQLLPAAAFGAPHLRYRVFLVAYAGSGELPLESESLAECGNAALPGWDGEDRSLSDADGLLRYGSREPGTGRRTELAELCGSLSDAHGPREQQRDGGEPEGRGRTGHEGSEGGGAIPDAGGVRWDARQPLLSREPQPDSSGCITRSPADPEGERGALRAAEGERSGGPSGGGSSVPHAHRIHDDSRGSGAGALLRERSKSPALCGGEFPRANSVGTGVEVFPRLRDDFLAELATSERMGVWREWWATEPVVGRVADGSSAGVDGYRGRLVGPGLPNRNARLSGLGNAVVSACAEYLGLLIRRHGIATGRLTE